MATVSRLKIRWVAMTAAGSVWVKPLIGTRPGFGSESDWASLGRWAGVEQGRPSAAGPGQAGAESGRLVALLGWDGLEQKTDHRVVLLGSTRGRRPGVDRRNGMTMSGM
jgi:hypothetical protein